MEELIRKAQTPVKRPRYERQTSSDQEDFAEKWSTTEVSYLGEQTPRQVSQQGADVDSDQSQSVTSDADDAFDNDIIERIVPRVANGDARQDDGHRAGFGTGFAGTFWQNEGAGNDKDKMPKALKKRGRKP